MPKIIYDNFSGGLTTKDRNIPTNQFNIGEGVDIYTNPGYIQPSPVITSLQTTAGAVLASGSDPSNAVVDSTNNKAYFSTANGKLYQMSSVTTNAFNANFDGGGHYYYAIPSWSSAVDQDDLIIYPIGTANYLFYSYNLAAAGDVGTYDLTSAFDPDYMSTVPAGKVALNKAPHPMIEWNTYLWIGNGRYLAKFDGQTPATLTPQALNLGQNWEITALFTTNNYIGICAWKKGMVGNENDCRVFFWDGVSTTFTYSIPIKEGNIIRSALNHNGIIYLSVTGKQRNSSGLICKLTENGVEPIFLTNLIINGTLTGLGGPLFQGLSVCQNKLFICNFNGSTEKACILAYGRERPDEPMALTFPHLFSSTAGTYVLFAKQLTVTKVFVGWNNASSVGTLSAITSDSATKGTAVFKPGYTDMGQKVRINYVKFYFKPLASGDSVTPTLDIDYGTSVTLKDNSDASTIAFSADGAVTSKKFMVGRDCHAFRPCLSWTAGATAFGKIVVDYSFLPD